MSAEPASGVIPIHGAAVAAILKLLDGQRLMTLATNRADGRPQASTLGYLNDGLNLYFVTARDSEKKCSSVSRLGFSRSMTITSGGEAAIERPTSLTS